MEEVIYEPGPVTFYLEGDVIIERDEINRLLTIQETKDDEVDIDLTTPHIIDLTDVSVISSLLAADTGWKYYNDDNDDDDNNNNNNVPPDVDVTESTTPDDIPMVTERIRLKNQCPVCSERFETRSKLQIHLQDRHNQFDCPYCDRSITHRSNMYRHIRRIHSDSATVLDSSICKICFRKFAGKEQMEIHLQNVHEDVVNYNKENEISDANIGKKIKKKDSDDSPVIEDKDDDESAYPCDICGKRFRTIRHLRRHQSSQHYNMKLECSYCHKFFSCQEFLFTHLTQFHKQKVKMEPVQNDEDQMLYPCPQCHKKLKTVEELQQHLNQSHGFMRVNHSTTENDIKDGNDDDDDEEEDEDVDVDYVSVNDDENEEKKSKYRCPYCVKIPKSHKMFRQHLRRVHHVTSSSTLDRLDPYLDENKNRSSGFACKRCGKTFKTRKIMRCHLRREHRLKLKPIRSPPSSSQFPCPNCDASLGTKSNLRRHILRLHGYKALRSHVKKMKSPSSSPSNCPSVCPHCDRCLKSEKYLRAHVLVVHEGYKPFLCETCNMRFSKTNHLRNHIEKTHRGVNVKIVKLPSPTKTKIMKRENLPFEGFIGFHDDLLHEEIKKKKELSTLLETFAESDGLSFMI